MYQTIKLDQPLSTIAPLNHSWSNLDGAIRYGSLQDSMCNPIWGTLPHGQQPSPCICIPISNLHCKSFYSSYNEVIAWSQCLSLWRIAPRAPPWKAALPWLPWSWQTPAMCGVCFRMLLCWRTYTRTRSRKAQPLMKADFTVNDAYLSQTPMKTTISNTQLT
jgi:hypothetical protein